MTDIYKQLKQYGDVKTNVNLAKLSTFKVGGTADLLVEVDEINKLSKLLSFLAGEGVNYLVIGDGSNILFPDEGFRGVIVKIKYQKSNIKNNEIEIGAGAPLAVALNEATQAGLSGLEWAAGMPGTVGGAVRGNAGAMGANIAGILDKVEVWQDGETRVLNRQECGFSYRHSIFKKIPAIILRAYFKLAAGDQRKILAATQSNIQKRAGKYPPYPSAGSFFKNIPMTKWTGDKNILPPKFLEYGFVPTGWLVEQVGLKGCQVGGAMVSKEHGNFIINFKNATAADILALVEKIKEAVYNKFKIELEEEVQIINS